jgi:hypothetical protein
MRDRGDADQGMNTLPRPHGGAGGLTDRVVYITSLVAYSAMSQAIDIGRLNNRVPGASQVIVAMLIGNDTQNIGLLP